MDGNDLRAVEVFEFGGASEGPWGVVIVAFGSGKQKSCELTGAQFFFNNETPEPLAFFGIAHSQ